LWQNLEWQQHQITLFGRSVAQPRLSAWYGDPGTSYRYSGLQLEPLAWQPSLLELKNNLNRQLQYPFNSVLANAYRDGSDSMGWHADNESELGSHPVIAAISLGAVRRFLIRKTGESQSSGLLLEHGSLLLMKGACQQVYQHSLPKTRLPVGLRISLTFRRIRY
jgi:alkylated DNA repair dioxygenase AlkB